MHSKVFLITILLCGLLAGCGQNRSAWTSEDDWYSPLPVEMRLVAHLVEWEQLDRDRIHEAGEGQMVVAEDLLDETYYVLLTLDQSADLPGRSPSSVLGT